MAKILTITLNPALDLATSAPFVRPGPKLRCGPERSEPGGGGVNVARAVGLLGGQAQSMVALGGPTGEVMKGLLHGLDLIAIDAPGETRHSLTVTDDSTGEQYRFVLPGAAWTVSQLEEMLQKVSRCGSLGDFIVFSGSMPPGADTGFLTQACATLQGRRVVIDTSGAHLAAVAKGHDTAPYVLRMDSHEANELAGRELTTQTESAGFADQLRRAGAAQIVIIARGKDGSVMADGAGLWHVNAANDHVVSAVGAGDSFVGGFVNALAKEMTASEALRHGAAAASAACLSEGTELCLPDDFIRLLPLTALTRL
jgi:6-phosphofructokinase 2